MKSSLVQCLLVLYVLKLLVDFPSKFAKHDLYRVDHNHLNAYLMNHEKMNWTPNKQAWTSPSLDSVQGTATLTCYSKGRRRPSTQKMKMKFNSNQQKKGLKKKSWFSWKDSLFGVSLGKVPCLVHWPSKVIFLVKSSNNNKRWPDLSFSSVIIDYDDTSLIIYNFIYCPLYIFIQSRKKLIYFLIKKKKKKSPQPSKKETQNIETIITNGNIFLSERSL